MRRLFLLSVLLSGAIEAGAAQADRLARVDASGVLRWCDDGSEVALLGVNYYTPFTIDFAELSRLGCDHRQVIREDVAHFRRLGLGCIRVHCFDREFSDAEGNLIDNRHVELLDFLLDECQRNGLYTVLTPIAWWGAGNWTTKTDGFSDRYEMRRMTTDRQAWATQARFLKQFAEHVNRFTGMRYADDPAVLAFECINEPLYPENTPDALVTEYINALADGLRAGGTTKPIYYNSWVGRNKAAGAARIDGVTGSVYPTGLVSGRALKGHQLFRARGSSLHPDEAIAGKSRMIYEFDAADVPGSHMYPSMAKFFRSEGVQVASQFQYDPLPLAAVNRNWMTHHLSLVYTPGKAISLAIAAEVFKRVPRGVTFGELPAAAVFPPFRCSGEDDLSEMVTDEAYLNSHGTSTPAPKPGALTRVWGCGSSPVVTCGGNGAYFFDRAAPGIWRLQLYPDVFVVADPYTGTTETKVCLLPGPRELAVRLPDLGGSFVIRTFDGQAAGGRLAKAKKGAFVLPPGDYLLTRKGGLPKEADLRLAGAIAPRYVAPKGEAASAPLLRAEVPRQWRAGLPLTLRADAVFATNVTARLTSAAGASLCLAMQAAGGTGYEAELPEGALSQGVWRVTFRALGPSGAAECPAEQTLDASWFSNGAAGVPLLRIPQTCDAAAGFELSRHGVQTAEVAIVEGRASGARALRLTVDGVGEGKSAAGYALPFAGRGAALEMPHGGLRVVANGGLRGAKAEIGFRMRNGQGLGCNLSLGGGWGETVVPFSEMTPLWGLPSAEAFRWQDVARVSVLTGAWLMNGSSCDRQTFDLESLEWGRLERSFSLRAAAGETPWSLFDPAAWLRLPLWSMPLRRWRVSDDSGAPAVHIGADRFDGERDSASLRAACDGKTFAKLWQTDGEGAVLHVRARAACPHTTAFELAFIEEGGVPWGTVVPLTIEWKTVRIPVSSLKLFTQWGKEYAEHAGPHLRLSQLESVNVCFGKWLFREHAAEPHAIEIAEIGVAAN